MCMFALIFVYIIEIGLLKGDKNSGVLTTMVKLMLLPCCVLPMMCKIISQIGDTKTTAHWPD